MHHGAPTNWGQDKAAKYKTRLGLWMFAAYCVVYAAFVIINSLWPSAMAKPLGSLNWATAYGFGLIALALILAMIYNSLSGRAEERFDDEYTDDEEEVF
jgi:uncharacterized membrane protein (DUF485 family)